MGKWCISLFLLSSMICLSNPESAIIPASTKSSLDEIKELDNEDREVVRHSLAYCFKERYEGIEQFAGPFFISRINKLRSLFLTNSPVPSEKSSSSSSGYGTPICATNPSGSTSLTEEIDKTIKCAVADSLKETLESYESRMRELEHRIIVQQIVIDAQENSTTPRERKKALLINTVTAITTTGVTAIVTYFATKGS